MSVRVTLIAAASFAAMMAGIGFIFAALAVRSAARFSTRPFEVADNFALAGYLALVAAAFGAIGFLIPTALARTWRGRPALHGVVAGALWGVAGFLVQLSGLAYALPVAWAGDGRFGPAGWLPWMVPGLVAGVLAAILMPLFPRPRAAV